MNAKAAHLRLETLGRISILTIDRPAKRNALTPPMIADLAALARGAAAGGTGALVLTGAGPAFCSGFDLAECRDAPDGSVMRELLTGLSGLVSTLRALPIPVVVAAHGAALAGGCAILGGGDVVLTNAEAKLGYPVVRIGVSPAVSAPFLVGMTHSGPARSRLLDPGQISGAEAVRVGLAHVCLATPEEVLPRAIQMAEELAAKPAGALHATKAWLLEQDEASRQAGEGLEASLKLTGGAEERELLSRALSPAPGRPE